MGLRTHYYHQSHGFLPAHCWIIQRTCINEFNFLCTHLSICSFQLFYYPSCLCMFSLYSWSALQSWESGDSADFKCFNIVELAMLGKKQTNSSCPYAFRAFYHLSEHPERSTQWSERSLKPAATLAIWDITFHCGRKADTAWSPCMSRQWVEIWNFRTMWKKSTTLHQLLSSVFTGLASSDPIMYSQVQEGCHERQNPVYGCWKQHATSLLYFVRSQFGSQFDQLRTLPDGWILNFWCCEWLQTRSDATEQHLFIYSSPLMWQALTSKYIHNLMHFTMLFKN